MRSSISFLVAFTLAGCTGSETSIDTSDEAITIEQCMADPFTHKAACHVEAVVDRVFEGRVEGLGDEDVCLITVKLDGGRAFGLWEQRLEGDDHPDDPEPRICVATSSAQQGQRVRINQSRLVSASPAEKTKLDAWQSGARWFHFDGNWENLSGPTPAIVAAFQHAINAHEGPIAGLAREVQATALPAEVRPKIEAAEAEIRARADNPGASAMISGIYAIFESATATAPIGYAIVGQVAFEPDGGETLVFGFDLTGKAVYEDESDF